MESIIYIIPKATHPATDSFDTSLDSHNTAFCLQKHSFDNLIFVTEGDNSFCNSY